MTLNLKRANFKALWFSMCITWRYKSVSFRDKIAVTWEEIEFYLLTPEKEQKKFINS